MPISTAARKTIFLSVTLLCLFVAAGYLVFAVRNANRAAAGLSAPVPQPSVSRLGDSENRPSDSSVQPAAPPVTKLPAAPATSDGRRQPESVERHSGRRLVDINLSNSPGLGLVEYSSIDAVDKPRVATGLPCERVYFAAYKGICL